jgi:signal transduction histidine kinase
MRRLLALLRESDEAEAWLAPQAGLSRLDALADEMSQSGLPVAVRREGEPVELPPGIDLSAYRIVQEALTNTLKHAGPARAEVVVRYLPGELELEVSDDGDGSGSAGGSGRGLAGVRERVDVYGGLLDAGPRPRGGGFLVRARLPLAATS